MLIDIHRKFTLNNSIKSSNQRIKLFYIYIIYPSGRDMVFSEIIGGVTQGKEVFIESHNLL